MARADKAATVAELTADFRESSAAVLTEYRGLTVAELHELRRALGDTASYTVVKNTLTKIAARDAGLEELESLLEGPSAIAFVRGDAVEAAKGIRTFARAHPLLVIKGGVLDGKMVSPADLDKIADLESREVLLAKLAGAMKASLTHAAGLFQAPLSQAARAVDALRAKAAEGAPAEPAPEAAAPEAEAPRAEATEAEATEAAAPEAEAPAEPPEA